METVRKMGWVALLLFLSLLAQIPNPVKAEAPQIYRGLNYIDTTYPDGLHVWESAPPWVMDHSLGEYRPYTFENHGTYYTVRTGLIAAEIHREKATFYSPEMDRLAVGRENWLVYEKQGDEWTPVCASLLPYFESSSYTGTPDYMEITGNWTTAKGTLNIIYHFEEKLKHTVTWTPTQPGAYAIVQFWNQTQYTDVTLGNGTVIRRTDGDAILGKTDGLTFQFGDESQPFGVHEDQRSAEDLFHKALFAKGTILYQGIQITDGVAWIFYNSTQSTVVAGQPITIDPDTATLNNPSEDGFIDYDNGAYGRYNGNDWLSIYDFDVNDRHRSYVEWDISGISDSANITDVVFKYHGKTHGTDAHIHNMTNRPSISAGNVIYSDAADGTIYADVVGFPVVGSGQQIDLGTSADDELEAMLASDWFAIGIDYEVSDSLSEIYSEEFATVNPAPTLYVTYTVNSAPTNDALSVVNPDDTNNLYAQLREYRAIVNTTDADSDTLTVDFHIKQGATSRAAFRYAEATTTFSQLNGSTAYALNTTGSTAYGSAGSLDVEFHWWVTFGATEEANVDVVVKSDDGTTTDSDTYSDKFDAVKTLTVSGFASSPVDYVNPSTTVTYTGTVYYVNNPASSTATTLYPPDAEFTAVHIHDAGDSSKGSDTGIANGAFSISFTSDAAVGADTYHPYIDMVDADYTDADVSGVTDPVTVDQVQVQSYAVSDSRIDRTDIATVNVTVNYASDSTAVTDGAITVNGEAASHLGSGVWRFTKTQSSATSVTYNTVAASGNTRGITSEDQNSQSQLVIWDEIRILTAGVAPNAEPEISEPVTFYVTADLPSDSHSVALGDSLVLNGYTFTWDAVDSRWEYSHTEGDTATVTINTFTSGNEATYGITVGNMNSKTVSATWGAAAASGGGSAAGGSAGGSGGGDTTSGLDTSAVVEIGGVESGEVEIVSPDLSGGVVQPTGDIQGAGLVGLIVLITIPFLWQGDRRKMTVTERLGRRVKRNADALKNLKAPIYTPYWLKKVKDDD